MKRLLLSILLFYAVSVSAQTGEELLQLVDSAYTEAMAGHLQEAVRLNEEGLAMVPADSIGLQCEFYSCLLFCYHRLGDYEQALHYGELCLSYDEAQGDKSNLSASLGNLAGIYSSVGKNDVAIDYLNRAIRLEEELMDEDPEHTGKSLAIRKAMLGEVLVAKAMGLPESERTDLLAQALQLTKDACNIDLELGRQAQVGMRLSQLGNIYKQLGDERQARECNERALAIARETGNRASEVITLLQLDRYAEAAELAQALGMKKQEMEACRHLVDEYRNTGRYEEALSMSERASALAEAMLNEETERQLTLWQVRYDTQQKEQQLLLQEQIIRAQHSRQLWLVVLALLAVVAVVLLVLYARLQKRILHVKDRNYAILTHDLKNPMLAQQQMLRLFYKNFDDYDREKVKENLGKLLANSDDQLDLLYNLQQMALIENGKQKVSPVRVDLGSIVNEVVNNLRSTADLKQITLSAEVKRSLVMADRESLRTVLRNLLSNAIKFSHEGGQVEIGNAEDGFYVRDHGIGMTEERVKELLSARQIIVSQSGTKGEGGTGIGLLLCRELIRRNDGTLTIVSKPHQGTTVTVQLPKSE